MAKKTIKVELPKFPEVGQFPDEKTFKAHVKPLTMDELQEWAALYELTVKPTDSAPIQRMRLIMAIKEMHFPTPPREPKNRSPYSKWTTEELVQMALDNEIIYEPAEDMKIMRMRTIMALRAHGIIE
ncbi:hypothetical protein D3C81_961420 [compost metagenome]